MSLSPFYSWILNEVTCTTYHVHHHLYLKSPSHKQNVDSSCPFVTSTVLSTRLVCLPSVRQKLRKTRPDIPGVYTSYMKVDVLREILYQSLKTSPHKRWKSLFNPLSFALKFEWYKLCLLKLRNFFQLLRYHSRVWSSRERWHVLYFHVMQLQTK